MANLSKIDDCHRLPVSITISPYLRDHVFSGHPVFPAVESMQLLAENVRGTRSGLYEKQLMAAVFDKFLVIPAGDTIEASIEIEKTNAGGVRAKLLTCLRLGGTGMTRIKEHARVCFSPRHKVPEAPDSIHSVEIMADMTVSPDMVYRELVPFGPAYRNLSGMVRLSPTAAAAEIRAPEFPSTGGPLGSPFVLDAAFHAACVWGQRYSGFIGFPVGFESRIILKATRPGGEYRVHVVPVIQARSENFYNLWIFTPDGSIYEVVEGLKMRDVTGGRMKPPAWIRDGS